MRIVKPLPVSITATNVTDSPYAEWASGTTYSIGNKVKYSAKFPVHEFEALSESVGVIPGTDSTIWLDLGPKNQHAMFDDRTGTKTTRTGGVTVTFTVGSYFDTLAVLALDTVTSVSVVVALSGQTLYSGTTSMLQEVASWFDFYFSPIDLRSSLILSPNIFVPGASVTLTLSAGQDDVVSCGLAMVGRSQWLGDTVYGASVGIEDYSTKEIDEWGNAFLLERAFSDRASISLELPTKQVDSLKKTLAGVRATPVLYDMNNSDLTEPFESLIIFGKYNSFEPSIDYHATSFCTLEVEGII
jgi:hypothetical protein